MSKFNKELLSQIKRAFVPSEQMQQQVATAQQEGAIQPSAPGQEMPPQGMQEIMGLLQEGFNAVIQGQQQLAQMVQQMGMTMQQGGGQGEKKKSTNERIDQLEQMVQQLVGGGVAPQGAPMPADPAAMDPSMQQPAPEQAPAQ